DSCLAKRREERYEQLEGLLADLTQLYEAHSDEPLPEVTTEAFTAIDYGNRGTTFGNLGQYERAIADCDRALALDPNYALAYVNRGTMFGELGQHERAMLDYDRALALDPTFALAYVGRGRSYGALGEHG